MRSGHAWVLGGFVAILIGGQVTAAELIGVSRADAVTVFPDGALVSRSAKVMVPPGESIIRLPGLPVGLDPDSLRAEAVAGVALELGAVDLKPVEPGIPTPHVKTETETRIEALEAERRQVEDAIRAAETERKFIERFTQIGAEGFVKALAEGKGTADGWRQAWAAVGEGMRAVAEAIRTADSRRRAIDEELARLRARADDESEAARPSNEARIAVTSPAPAPVEATVTLTYRVAAARWTPVYDARLGLDKGKAALELVSRAAISQTSGEDWTDVVLTLSTARTKRATGAPKLDALTVRIAPPPRPIPLPTAPPPAAALPEARQRTFAAPKRDEEAAAVDAPGPVAANEREAQIEDGGLAVTFRIAGRTTVPAGDEVKTVRVASQRLEPALVVRTVPKRAESGYLLATFMAGGTSPLLPGRVALFRDQVFIGHAQLPFTPAGDKIELGFGEDDRVKVARVAVRKVEGETGVFTASKVDDREFKITVRNLSADPITVEVRDQVPVSESQDVVIEPLAGMTEPTARNVDDVRGVLAWRLDLKPKEERDIRLGWRVRYPADKPISWSQPVR